MYGSLIPDVNAVQRKLENYLGESTNINDDPRKKAQFLDAYDSNRKALLRMHYWPFANGQASLQQVPQASQFFYRYFYALPPDFIGKVYLNSTGEKNVDQGPYQLSGSGVYYDAPKALLSYTRNVVDEREFDSLFIEAVASRMAIELCLPWRQDKELLEQLKGWYAGLKFETLTVVQRDLDSNSQVRANPDFTNARRVPGYGNAVSPGPYPDSGYVDGNVFPVNIPTTPIVDP